MKRTGSVTLRVGLLILILLAGCRAPRALAPDIQATIDAAIAATNTAQASAQATPDAAPGTQATIDAAVAATNAVQASAQATPDAAPDTQATGYAAVAATGTAQANVQVTVDAAVEATSVAAPTPTPSAEHVTMTEEELAALIDQAVAEADAATQEYSAATAEATADDAITQEELEMMQSYAVLAEDAIAYADELISLYYDLYAELAVEMIDVLVAIEEDLATLAETAAAMNAMLEEVDAILEQGLELADETIDQLEDAARAAAGYAAEAHAQTLAWMEKCQAGLENRVARALAVQPNNIAADPKDALQSAFLYVDAVRQAVSGNNVSKAELANIAQLGANANASLAAQGGPQLQQLSGTIKGITEQLARGNVAQATAGLGALEASLGSIPAKPSLPKPPRPSRP